MTYWIRAYRSSPNDRDLLLETVIGTEQDYRYMCFKYMYNEDVHVTKEVY
jgi:hypothetical protein